MATIIEKMGKNGEKSRYILVGAGRVPSNFGSEEKDFLVGCNKEGCVKVLTDYECTLRIINIDGKTPSEILGIFNNDKPCESTKKRC